jgi:hypothetical protein
MPALLTTSSTMMCPHGGTVTAVPGQSQAIGDSPVLRMSDTCTVAGCAFTIPPAEPSPCVTVQWVVAATQVQAGGDFVLHEGSVGLCLAATQAPQGPVMIVSTQALASGI